jgi:hypothetical protein
LGEELHHGREENSVKVAGNKEHFLDFSKSTDASGGLKLMLMCGLDVADLANNVVSVCGLLTDPSHGFSGLLRVSLLDKEAGRLLLQEAEEKDDAGEHDVKTGRYQPLVGRTRHVEVAAVVGKVCQDDADVDGTCEEASTKTTDGGGSNLCNINGPI